jgi:hypothetical protein
VAKCFGCPSIAKVDHLNHYSLSFSLGCIISILMSSSALAQVKAKPAPNQVAQAPMGSCVIAEFRYIAMTHHDPQERLNKAIDWFQKNGLVCSPTQLSILISSKASLLGTSDGIAMDAVIDRIVEKRMGNDHSAVSRYYRPDVQGPARGREDSAPAKTTESGPAPAGMVGGAASPSGPPTTVVAMAGAPAPGAISGATGSPNININMGGAKPPEEDMSRKYPLPSEPLFSFPPEYGAPVINYFGKIRRQFVRSFFMENLSPGKCPEGMAWRNDACEAGMKVAWRFGEKLPQGAKTYPVEAKLVEKLNFDPGYTFVRVGGDILALERDTGKVADAVLNLGKTT